MKLDRVDRAFVGFVVAAGIGLFALPFCVLLNVPPAIWGSVTIGALPLGALIGYLSGKPSP